MYTFTVEKGFEQYQNHALARKEHESDDEWTKRIGYKEEQVWGITDELGLILYADHAYQHFLAFWDFGAGFGEWIAIPNKISLLEFLRLYLPVITQSIQIDLCSLIRDIDPDFIIEDTVIRNLVKLWKKLKNYT